MAKRIVKGLLRRLGYEIWRSGTVSPPPDFWPWLRATQNIRTVIDIGASNGEFATFLNHCFRPAATYVFEPLAWCMPALRAQAASIPNLHIFQIGLSDRPGRETLFVNSHAPSTSFLRTGEIQRVEFPQAAEQIPTPVDVSPLDDLLNPDHLEKNIFIKMDVEGFEDRVIRGGRKMFSATQCVLVEMSFVLRYEGQPLFEEVHALLVDLGFRLAGMKNQIHSSRSGQPLFGHWLYLRSDVPANVKL